MISLRRIGLTGSEWLKSRGTVGSEQRGPLSPRLRYHFRKIMQSKDIVNAGADSLAVAKNLAPHAGEWPFGSVAKRIPGPACDEIAERWRDAVRVYRYGRQLECVRK